MNTRVYIFKTTQTAAAAIGLLINAWNFVFELSTGASWNRSRLLVVCCFKFLPVNTHVFLHIHNDELDEEALIISAVIAVPDSKEYQSRRLAVNSRPQELQPFIDILGTPMIGICVERSNVVTELSSVLEHKKLHILTTVPFLLPVFLLAVVRYPESDTGLRRQILVFSSSRDELYNHYRFG